MTQSDWKILAAILAILLYGQYKMNQTSGVPSSNGTPNPAPTNPYPIALGNGQGMGQDGQMSAPYPSLMIQAAPQEAIEDTWSGLL